MRIVLIQDHLRTGGTEQQSLAIARELAGSGLETHLIVFRKGGPLDEAIERSDARIHYLNQGLLKTDWFAPGLKRLIDSINPHVVFPMGRMANCHAGLFASDKSRKYKIVATFRTGRNIPFLYRRALKKADHIVANSRNALARLSSQYDIDRPAASSVIYNGCIRDFDTYLPNMRNGNSKAIHLVSVSMFRPQKKQIRLIRICSKIPKDIEWKLTLAGAGVTLEDCKLEAQTLNVAKRVEFVGLLKDPRSLYQSADIAIHTSDEESLPNFLVEAQMAGLPVIAYDVDGVGESFLDNQSGHLIPHRNESKFLNKLTNLIRDPERQIAMSKAAKSYAKSNFSLHAQTQAYLELVKRLAPESAVTTATV